jgi:tetratricopeptide (TPR) repeat protein
MVLEWLFGKKAPEKPVIKKVSRREASDEWVKYGEDLANGNRIDEALDAFEKALQIYPKNEYAWGDKALMLEKKGATEDALAAFSNAITIDPGNPKTWNNKGLALLKLKRTEQAIECFDKAIEKDAGYAKAWYNKGRALSLIGRINESQKCFDTSRKLDPLLHAKLKRMKW